MSRQGRRLNAGYFLILTLGIAGTALGQDFLSGKEDALIPAPQYVLALVPSDSQISLARYSPGCFFAGMGALDATHTNSVTGNSGTSYTLQTSYHFLCEAFDKTNPALSLQYANAFQDKYNSATKAIQSGKIPEKAELITGRQGVGYIKAISVEGGGHTTYYGEYYALSDNVYVDIKVFHAASTSVINGFIANAEAVAGSFAEEILSCAGADQKELNEARDVLRRLGLPQPGLPGQTQ